MTLLDALRLESTLRPSVATGASAIQATDRALVADDQLQRIEESLDLDEATRAADPQGNRWDYLLAIRGHKALVALEPHSAKDSEIKVVIAKKEAARVVLNNHVRAGCGVAWWIWVTRGHVGFSPMEKARRRLAQRGILFAGRCVKNLTP